ncbi:hypothetical protein FQN54_005147 [Arachnomyces sp. PD_36]|nr:hypothetical protein FQN54_005147 [Arachnomyces sp. PD_36]
MAPTSTIPTFSLPSLRAGERRAEFLHCISTQGIFHLTSTGLSSTFHQTPRDMAIRFFENSSLEEKRKVSAPDARIRRGFTGLETESTARITGGGSFTDYSMSYSMGVGGNMFPSEEFRGEWEGYFEGLDGVAREVAREVLRVGGLVDGKEYLVDRCDPLLRLRYYPEVPAERVAEEEPLRMASHYDLSTVTLIHQTGCPNGFVSLQCEVEGEYVDVGVSEDGDEMVVLCGAVATLATDGVVKAPHHRVVAPGEDKREGSSRTSSVFFLRPDGRYSFSVGRARECGFTTSLKGERATFDEWIGGNYVNLREGESSVGK